MLIVALVTATFAVAITLPVALAWTDSTVPSCYGDITYLAHYWAVGDGIFFFVEGLAIGLLVFGNLLDRSKAVAFSIGTAVVFTFVTHAALTARALYLDTLSPALTGVMAILVGILWFFVAESFWGAERWAALAVAYLAGCGVVFVALPSVVQTVTDKAPAAALALVLLFVAALWYALEQYATGAWSSRTRLDLFRATERQFSKRLQLDSSRVLAGLMEAERVIKQHRARPVHALCLAGPALNRMAAGQYFVEHDLEKLKDVFRSLEDFDGAQYVTLHDRLHHLPRQVQAGLRQELVALRKRLRVDEQERKLTAAVAGNSMALAKALREVLAALRNGNTSSALRHLETARRLEARAQKLCANMACVTQQCQKEAVRVVTRRLLSPEAREL